MGGDRKKKSSMEGLENPTPLLERRKERKRNNMQNREELLGENAYLHQLETGEKQNGGITPDGCCSKTGTPYQEKRERNRENILE